MSASSFLGKERGLETFPPSAVLFFLKLFSHCVFPQFQPVSSPVKVVSPTIFNLQMYWKSSVPFYLK